MADTTTLPHRRDRVAARFERLLVTDPADVGWLSGVRPWLGPAYLWLEDGEWTVLLPDDEADLAPDGFAAMTYPGYELGDPAGAGGRASAALAEGVGGRDWWVAGTLPAEAAARFGVTITGNAAAALAEIRQVKDGDEIRLIRENVRALDEALVAVRDLVEPGRREAELWAALLSTLGDRVGDAVVPAGNLGSGERSLLGDPHATQRVLRNGDAVLLDAYPLLRGYAVDLSRTWFCGDPPAGLVRAHTAVDRALHEVGAQLRPGLTGGEVDALARQALSANAPGADYPHHTGHGIGVAVQEPPWLIPGSGEVLSAGMVVAVEPGLYQPDLGGVRLEQNYLVTPQGAEPLSEVSFAWQPHG